jgi:hypothetical protein
MRVVLAKIYGTNELSVDENESLAVIFNAEDNPDRPDL